MVILIAIRYITIVSTNRNMVRIFIVATVVFATRRSRDIKIPLYVSPRSEKFNIVSNNHGRTEKCDLCFSVGKTNFRDHHTPDIINGFRDSALVCKMHDCYCTIRKNFEHFHSFSSSDASGKRLKWLNYMKTNHFKMLLNVFSTTYTYSNCIKYQLFYSWKIT